MRFTVDGSQALENRIAHDLYAIREAVLPSVEKGNLLALVLGGGYGRGEGGVFVDNGEEKVYNDYDFFVIVSHCSFRRRRALMNDLAEVKALMEPQCGIHVDFSPAMSHKSLANCPYELMFMEAREGHHVVIGPNDIFETMPAFDTAHPPLEEGARLFMNRGVGLVLAKQKLDCDVLLSSSEHEFVVRNIRKAQLAMGDALLILRGCYSPSYIERLKRFRLLDLGGVPYGDKLTQYYEEALEFKLRPSHVVPAGFTMQAWFDEVTHFYDKIFLWFEQHRLSDLELTWERYQRLPRRLASQSLKESFKNVLRNMRVRTSEHSSIGQLYLHPRDRVLAFLPSLLFDKKAGNDRITTDVLRLWEVCG